MSTILSSPSRMGAPELASAGLQGVGPEVPLYIRLSGGHLGLFPCLGFSLFSASHPLSLFPISQEIP